MERAPRVRPCVHTDFGAVVALLQQLWPDTELSDDRLRPVWNRALASDAHVLLCAVEQGDVVGFASLAIHSTLCAQGLLAHIDELVVDERHRGGRLGAELLLELVAIARMRGCTRIELQSGNHRAQAHRFYEKHGFQNDEVRTYFKLL